MPKVYNKKAGDAVYIGRPSKWGNPFAIGRDGTREEVIHKFDLYLFSSGLIDNIGELADKDLVCWCAPQACHGDILVDYAARWNRDPVHTEDYHNGEGE